MNSRTRLANLLTGRPVDRVPWLEEGPRDEVLARWQAEGMPAGGPASVFTYDRRERIEVDVGLRPKGAKGLVHRAELAAWRANLDRPLEQRLPQDWAQRVQRSDAG